MYTPAAFSEHDPEVIAHFIDHHPLATLVGVANAKPLVDHVPFMRNEPLAQGSRLIAHVAKGNATWRRAESSEHWMLVFTGATAYVSPSLYPSKQQTHEVVPTYNYVSVHLTGTLRCSHTREDKLRTVETLTQLMESKRAAPWAVSDAPSAYIDRMLEGIVALEFTVIEIVAKTKASQNRLPQDQRGVLDGLAADPATHEAAAIIARRLGN
ncbi:MAG: FMN-binding negative transcriptional regulator [Gammaproteobacteria bacterium]|nr:FMN-binding negative transcriptional regulator [Gammaproteobacteria bacterium]